MTVGRRERPPIAGESLDGYAAFRAERLGLSSILEIAELLEIDVPGRVRLSRCGADAAPLASFLAIDEAEVESRLQPLMGSGRRLFSGVAIDRLHVVRNHRLFAPQALAKSPHHRAAWDLRPFPFSEETWEHLHGKCPDPLCKRQQGWHHTLGVDACDLCGEPLTRATALYVPQGDQKALKAAVGLFHHDPARREASDAELPDWLKNIERGDTLDLLVALAGVYDPTVRCRSAKRTLRVTAEPEKVSAAIASAWRMLPDWPSEFERLAAERCGQRAGRFGDGNQGATMDFLALADLDGTPTFLKHIVTLELARLRGEAHGAGIETADAGRLRGMTATAVADARRAGTIATVFAVAGDRPVPLLHRKTVEDISLGYVESMPVELVVAALGCTMHGVEQMLSLELLGGFQDLHFPIGKGTPRVPIAHLERLGTQLMQQSQGGGVRWIGLARVICGLGGRRKPYGPIIQMLLNGELPFNLAVAKGPLLDRVNLPPDALASLSHLTFDSDLLPADRCASFVGKGDAMVELNLHERDSSAVLGEWPTNRRTPTVPVVWLEDMCRRYITVLEIAARLGKHGQAVIHLLASYDIETVRACLYDRDQIEEMLSRSLRRRG